MQLKILGQENENMVVIKDGETELGRHADLQHNRNYREKEAMCAALMKTALAEWLRHLREAALAEEEAEAALAKEEAEATEQVTA